MAQQTLNTPRETTHRRIADALEDIVDKIVDTSSAGNIDYDNTESGLDATKVQGAVDELASEKVDKVQGKGLSTNDYTDTEKQKLAGIEAGANKTVVDFFMNADSTNPLQNRVVNAFLNEKTDISNFNALTQEIKLFNTYDLTNDVEISVFANDTYKRTSRFYESHIPNLDGEYSVSLGDKTFTETCTFTIANEGKSITEVFHTNRKYILGAKLLKAENDEVGDMHVIADVVTLLISKDAPYTTTFDPDFEHPPVTGVLTLKVSVKPDEKYVNKENTGGSSEYAYWGSYNGSDLLINNPILTYSETTFGQPKVSGNPITIESSESNLVECVAEVEAVQDLHGYDAPWVGGAGKNKFDIGDVSSSYWNVSGEQITNAITDTRQNLQLVIQGYYNGQYTGISYLQENITSTGRVSFTFTIGNNDNVDQLLVKHNGTQQDIIISFVNWTQKGDVTISFDVSGYNPTVAGGVVFSNMQIESGSTATTYEPYSNISPITGQTEVVIDDVGKNLFDSELSQGGIYFDTGNNYSSNIYVRTDFIPLKKGTYTISQNIQNAIRFYDKNKIYNRSKGIETFRTANTITLEDDSYIKIVFRASDSSNITPSSVSNIQLEVGDTATTYEPYNGKTYTIDLDGTRYGGTLDVVSGVMTVDKGYISDLSSLSWELQGTGSDGGTIFYAIVGNKKNSAKKGICSSLQTMFYDGWTSTRKGTINLGHSTKSIFASIEGITTVEDFKTTVTGQTLVYELAEPYTIKLTPQQIRLLKGTNNISCNTGDLSIKYYPDNVLGQLKGDIEGEYDERVETLETQVQELQPSLIFMSRERRDITSDLSRLSIAVAEQNLAKYGYKIGDYFERVDGNRTYTYHIADYNTFKGTSTPYCLTTNHIGIVVDTHATTQWYSGDASAVGYNGSTLHTYLKGTVMDNIKADMIYFFGGTTGLEHLLAHSKLLTTALANWGWQASQYISALSEVQTIGSVVWGANGYQTGEAAKKLELFDKYKWTEIFEGRYPWLRDLYTSSNACILNYFGLAHYYGVTYSTYAVGLIIFY